MKSFIHWATLCTLIISITGCSTVRLKYEADYKVTGQQQTNRMVYENDYSAGYLRWACVLTGWIWGGACWGYLAMPFESQKKEVRKDARKKLLTETKLSAVDIHNGSIERAGWGFWSGDKEYFKNYGWSEKSVKSTPKKKEKVEEDLEGFIQ